MAINSYQNQLLKYIGDFKKYCESQIQHKTRQKPEIDNLRVKIFDIKWGIGDRDADGELSPENKKIEKHLEWHQQYKLNVEKGKLLYAASKNLTNAIQNTVDDNVRANLTKQRDEINKQIKELSSEYYQLEANKPNQEDLKAEQKKILKEKIDQQHEIINRLAKSEAENLFDNSVVYPVDYEDLLQDLDDLQHRIGRLAPNADFSSATTELNKLFNKLGYHTTNLSNVGETIKDSIDDIPQLPVLEPSKYEFAFGDRRSLVEIEKLTKKVNEDLEEIESIRRSIERNPALFNDAKKAELGQRYLSLSKRLKDLKNQVNEVSELLPSHPDCKEFTDKLNRLLFALHHEESSTLSKKLNSFRKEPNYPKVPSKSYDPNAAKALNEEKVIYLYVEKRGPHGEITGYTPVDRQLLTGEDGKRLKFTDPVINDAVAEFNRKNPKDKARIIKITENGKQINRILFPKQKQNELVEILKAKAIAYDKEKNKETQKAEVPAKVTIQQALEKKKTDPKDDISVTVTNSM